MFKALAEIVTAEGVGRKRGNDFFDLLRDDAALDEIGHIEDFAEDALGELCDGLH